MSATDNKVNIVKSTLWKNQKNKLKWSFKDLHSYQSSLILAENAAMQSA